MLAAPLVAGAQQAGKVPRVGVLSPGNPPPGDAFHQRERFEADLRELGWKPGSNIVVDYRYAEGKLEHLPGLAAELVRLPVDVIVARGLTIAAARQATAQISIVMAADPDPVRSGFVASLARPGGNTTGFSTQALDSEPKQLEFLREALPSLERVAVLTNANSPDRDDMRRIEKVARTLRLELTEYPITGSEELDAVFARMSRASTGAILVSPLLWFINAKQLAALALKHRQPTSTISTSLRGSRSPCFIRRGLCGTPPTCCHVRRQALEGREARRPSRRAAHQVRAGDQPQDRQGPRPHKPPSLLARADQVIE
jgi:putative ABC transport system substrate-binding protein